MCYACCKGCKLWCKAFTKTERCLTLLEAILLILLIALIVFLILHFVACSKQEHHDCERNGTANKNIAFDLDLKPVVASTVSYNTTEVYTTNFDVNSTQCSTRETRQESFNCTWVPSMKTEPVSRYYMNTGTSVMPKTETQSPRKSIDYDFYISSTSDGEEVEPDMKKSILALVKITPRSGVSFGCVLTVVHRHWALTAASCVELVEEHEQLHSYVIMEDYGQARPGTLHIISDLKVHPLYQGGNRSYDLAAIKSEDSLQRGTFLRVATPIQYNILTLGEMFHLIGFGGFRTASSLAGRVATSARVWMMDGSLCEGEYAPLLRTWTDARYPSICATVLYARGHPCNYCAGSPLILERVLYGIMSHSEQCGINCEPALFVNLASRPARQWIHSITGLTPHHHDALHIY